MITLIMIAAVLLIFPDILKKSDERYKEKRKKEEYQRMLSQEIKRGKRWG